ncbi:sulfatase-like hydrolase/transferase [bacterium]|nr:sulfatase-like hydrolase/transferase [bacterium]
MIAGRICLIGVVILVVGGVTKVVTGSSPHIVLVMADDQGWGQTGYYKHPVLKTPHLDAMAESGLRFDRFYAGAPVCSPTRASVLTGRANDRTGVLSHGYALRRQEITLPAILTKAGYRTGHFGKWHLNALRGPGVPILKSDDHNPGEFGFETWLSVTNFFDRDPILSRLGQFEEFEGDSSEVVVDEALSFLQQNAKQAPTFTVIWYGTPHSPFKAADADMVGFETLDEVSRNHYGELVAMDRSLGKLRKGLRELGIADHTVLWFCSDNGGLPKIKPDTVGGLRGNKGTIYEGGLRVPAILEWPEEIKKPRITNYPASVLDILPTILAIADVQYPDPERPLDGVSLVPLMGREIGTRKKPIPFRHTGRAALIDNNMKLLTNNLEKDLFALYDLANDPAEQNDIAAKYPDAVQEMRKQLLNWSRGVDASAAGKDYPSGKVDPSEPEPRFWTDVDEYKPYFDEWRNRWEYSSRLKKPRK